MSASHKQLAIKNGRLLCEGGETQPRDLVLEEGLISHLGASPGHCRALDAKGLLVLSGILDIHGDAFERQLMPRPNVHVDPAIGLQETDHQLLSNGITTAFHGITHSWEPGLRGEESCVALLEHLARLKLKTDTHVHLRFETYNIDGATQAEKWIRSGKVSVLAFNDHTPALFAQLSDPNKLQRLSERTGLSTEAYGAAVTAACERGGEVGPVLQQLALAARESGVAMMSHDDKSPEVRRHYHRMGCQICEFPQNTMTAITARELDNHVVMGAPNVMRGGSHNRSVAATDLIESSLCTVLASDYYYPAPLHAAFKLARDGVVNLWDAWRLVSANVADAVGLRDRGSIEQGKRADLILVDDADPTLPRVVACLVKGEPVYLTRDIWCQ